MSFQLARVLAGYQPVHYLPDGLVLWRRGVLYRADLALDRIERLCALPTPHALLTRFAPAIVARILRAGIRSSAMIDDDILLVAQRGTIFAVSISRGEWWIDFGIPDGRRLLSLSIIETEADARTACFGDYFHNRHGAAVGVWRRTPGRDGTWTRSAEFAPGQVEHIHAVTQTRDGRVWVLGGDLGAAAGLWRSDPALEELTAMATGAQAYRACWLWQAPDGVCHYATDSNVELNRLMHFAGAGPIQSGVPLRGSSIYGGAGETYVAFSTSVEPGEPTGNILRDFSTRRPGPGIVGDMADIHVIEQGRLSTILSARADGWPLRLAQFATFSFPGGTLPADRFHAFGRAVHGYDGACLLFERG